MPETPTSHSTVAEPVLVPSTSNAPGPARAADHLLAMGKDLQAAKEYIRAAGQSHGEEQLRYLENAAKASLEGNRPKVALLLSAEVLRLSKDPAQRGQAYALQAQAYQRLGQSAAARGALESYIAIPSVPADKRAAAMAQLANLFQTDGHDLTALDFLVKRDPLLSPADQLENHRKIRALLDAQTSAKLKNWQGRSGDPIVQEWLAFALIARQHPDPASRQAAFASWLQAHPGRPDIGYENLPSTPGNDPASGSICTLLPTSGRFANQTQSFIAGLEGAAAQESGPPIHVLSDSSDPALNASVYAKGVAAGCAAFVGPRLPQDVRAVLAARHPQDPPILLLDRAATSTTPGVYWFDNGHGVAARQLARDAFAHGFRQALILYPLDSTGASIQADFLAEWQQLGGQVVSTAHYASKDPSASSLHGLLAAPLAKNAFIFLVAKAEQLPKLVASIRAYSARPILLPGVLDGGLTSIPSTGMDGVYILTMPWESNPTVLQSPLAQRIRNITPPSDLGNWRLAGLGVDAYGILLKILSESNPQNLPEGVSGKLHWAHGNSVELDFDWAGWAHGGLLQPAKLPSVS